MLPGPEVRFAIRSRFPPSASDAATDVAADVGPLDEAVTVSGVENESIFEATTPLFAAAVLMTTVAGLLIGPVNPEGGISWTE